MAAHPLDVEIIQKIFILKAHNVSIFREIRLPSVEIFVSLHVECGLREASNALDMIVMGMRDHNVCDVFRMHAVRKKCLVRGNRVLQLHAGHGEAGSIHQNAATIGFQIKEAEHNRDGLVTPSA